MDAYFASYEAFVAALKPGLPAPQLCGLNFIMNACQFAVADRRVWVTFPQDEYQRIASGEFLVIAQ